MRKLGCYSFTAKIEDDQRAEKVDFLEETITRWLESKGASKEQALAQEATVRYADGREAKLRFESIAVDSRGWLPDPGPTKISAALSLFRGIQLVHVDQFGEREAWGNEWNWKEGCWAHARGLGGTVAVLTRTHGTL